MDKNLEVRMYTRDRDDGLTELYFLDRSGSPRIVAQLESGQASEPLVSRHLPEDPLRELDGAQCLPPVEREPGAAERRRSR